MSKRTNVSGTIASIVVAVVILGLLNVVTFAIPFNKIDLAVHLTAYGCAELVIIIETILVVTQLFVEDKANQKPKYRFSVERLGKYMPTDLNDKQAEEYVLKALSYYKKHLDRKAQKEIDKKQ